MQGLIFDVITKTPTTHWIIMAVSFATVLFYFFILGQDTKKQSSKFFLIFSVVIFIWGSMFILFDAALGTPAVHIMVQVVYFIAGFVAPTLYFAIDTFSNGDKHPSFKKILIVIGPHLLMSVGFFFPGMMVSYQDTTSLAHGRIAFGPLSILYVLYNVVLVTSVLGLLIKRYRVSAGIFKLEMREFLITFIITATSTLVSTLFLPFYVGTQNFFWFGYSSGALTFLVVIGFIFTKYNFWSFKVIATEFFVSVIFLALLIEFFFASSALDLTAKILITILVLLSSFFLVGTVRREIDSHDKIEKLIYDLDILHARLKNLDKKKSEFLSIASHHLRDPLTAIKGYASMLSEGSFGELPTLVKEAIEKIFDSSNRLITMISDFMDISRIESGDMNYKFIDVDMKRLVTETANEMKQSAERAHLALSLVIEDGNYHNEQFITVGDPGKLRQVISNLIDNSIKYSPEGGIRLTLGRNATGDGILFSVADTGIGMNELTKDKIFRKFSRAEGVNKIYTEGTGLGLYVAKEIVKKHNGEIWAESDGEKLGSTFYVELKGK